MDESLLAQENLIYVGINIWKCVQDLYCINYWIFLRNITESDSMERLNMVDFNPFQIIVLMNFNLNPDFFKNEKAIQNFIQLKE